MTIPSIAFGLIVSLLIGALFHLWRGGGGGRLLLYLVLSVLGFTIGHLIGNWRGWILFPVGPLDLGLGVIGSLVFLIAGYWLSQVQIRGSDADDDAV